MLIILNHKFNNKIYKIFKNLKINKIKLIKLIYLIINKMIKLKHQIIKMIKIILKY